jgi:Fe-S-cluster-containing dehydrogenase component
MGKKAFVFDIAKCSGCYCCQLACKDEHCGNDWTPIAKPQPDIGQFWIKVNDYVNGTSPKVKVHYVPEMCNHCANPACVAAAKNGAAYQREDGLVIIDPEKAVGQKQIAEACPYGAIYWNEELDIPQKCTGCAHLLDNGYAKPRCVEMCPTEALVFGDEDELQDLIVGATVMQPETGLKPRVYYRNIPGQFIAGTVYDPEAKEVIIGARCRAITGGKLLMVNTDEYGDFWFKDLAVGVYDVYIEAKGYKSKSFTGLRTTECINLGDIPLEKE